MELAYPSGLHFLCRLAKGGKEACHVILLLEQPDRLAARLKERKPNEILLEKYRPASVLLLIDTLFNEKALWFVQRSHGLRSHPGQIAFPGGKEDASDPTPWHTALRECHEEIDCQIEQIQFLGQLDDCWTPTGFRIRPFVGYNHGPSPSGVSRSPGEVDRAFAMPLKDLWEVPGEKPWPSYPSPHGQIWGATARILCSWLDWLKLQEQAS